MEIAVIGSGISGLSASLFLSKNNDVTLYEKNNYLGGHTNTKTINYRDKKINAENFLLEYSNPYKTIISDKKGTVSIEFGAYGFLESFRIYDNKIKKRYIGAITKSSYLEIKNFIKWK